MRSLRYAFEMTGFNIMKEYDLIIFDCDGTLVDSEYLNNKVSAELITEFGIEGYDADRCIIEFAGTSWTDIKKILDARHNVDIPKSLIDQYIARVQERMREELNAVEGALDFVVQSKNKTKICVASNGMRTNVVDSLQLTDFMDHFLEDQVFTKIQVPNPKPAPDLFLFAADKMNVSPNKCLVIEDSVAGATAGVAAGMDVFGFTGTAHDQESQAQKLHETGLKAVFGDFIHMAEVLGY